MSQPTINELSYQIRQLTNDIMNHESLLTSINSQLYLINNTLALRRTYLKQVLIFKAEKKIPSNINDYIGLLCSVYKKHPETLDLGDDTTPGWLIADAVISETNDKDRIAFTDIFTYVYGYNPQTYFV